ncbi:MAG: ribonuclease III [Bacillales bacterium]|nr:ribonuclease III [Bacillales bacterium]
MIEIRDILKEFGITTNKPALYRQAFTHASFVHEMKNSNGDYERLEFIGDGVLDLVIADIVFKLYPSLNQGDLSKIRIYFVNGNKLTEYAKKYHFDQLLLLGHGQKINGGSNAKILEDVFEAFLGAVYLDQGFNKVYEVVNTIFKEDIKNVPMDVIKDYKSQLQEFVQADTRNSVTYRLVSEKGNPPNTEFTVEVMWDNQVFGVGVGTSKKRAEQEAAKDALSKVAR